MIRKGSGHEFHSGPREWSRNMLVVPPTIKGDLTHWKTCWEGEGVFVNNSFESQVAAKLGGASDPIITHLQIRIRRLTQIEIRATPKTVALSLKRLIH